MADSPATSPTPGPLAPGLPGRGGHERRVGPGVPLQALRLQFEHAGEIKRGRSDELKSRRVRCRGRAGGRGDRITLKGPDIGLGRLGLLGSGVAAVYLRRRRQASFA